MVGSSVPASAPPPQATSAVAISSERVTKVVDGWWTGWRGEAGVGIEVDMLDFIETTGRVTRTAPQGKGKKRGEKPVSENLNSVSNKAPRNLRSPRHTGRTGDGRNLLRKQMLQGGPQPTGPPSPAPQGADCRAPATRVVPVMVRTVYSVGVSCV